tara:strand:- start:4982 stop:6508 length:1527 start_codon:yes stop_codon:yes gene_type:complete
MSLNSPKPIIMEREPRSNSQPHLMRLTAKEINITNNKSPTSMPNATPANISFSHDNSEQKKITIPGKNDNKAAGKGAGIAASGNTKLHIKRNDTGSGSDATAKENKKPRISGEPPKFIKGQQFHQKSADIFKKSPFGGGGGLESNVALDTADLKSFANPTKSREAPQGMGAFGTYMGDRHKPRSEDEFSEEGSDGDVSSLSEDEKRRAPQEQDGYTEYSDETPSQKDPAVFQDGQDNIPTKQLSKSERQQLKYDLLSKIQALERKGIHTSKRFSSKHKLIHIQAEYNRLSQMLANEAGVKFGRKLLMGFVSVTEWMNNRFDPVGAKLEGWSESVMENIEDFDHSLERIVEKWTSHVEVAPEMELMTALAGSAFMFHMSKSILSNPSAIFQAMGSQKPDMMENMMRKMMSGVTGGGNNVQDDDDDDDDDEMSPPRMNLNPMQQAGISTRGKQFSKNEPEESSSEEGSETDVSSDDELSETESSSSEDSRNKLVPKAKMVSVPVAKKGKK